MKERIANVIVFLSVTAVWFATTFTSLRVYEYFALSNSTVTGKFESLGFLYDWPFACSLALGVTLVSCGLAIFSERVSKIFSITLYCILLVVSFFIIQYFSVTNVPLSADLFGYSIEDIRTTVSSSGGIDASGIFFLLLYVAVFVIGALLLSRSLTRTLSAKVAVAMLILLLAISLVPAKPTPDKFESDVQYNLVVNKPEYFLERSMNYLRENTGDGLAGYKSKPFPFYHKLTDRDVLGNYFNFANEKPNLVFLFVEGLGADFSGPTAKFGGFTPFLDSLSRQSLYWRNALSNTGRTFGVLPSALGSLPYGKDGFLSYGVNMPDHQTLISLLKTNGYTANYFYGGNPNFDNQDIFLQYQGIDYFLNESNFPLTYNKAESTQEGFSWGYTDRDVLNYSLEILKERAQSPRIDVYLTLTTHEPFISPDKLLNAQVENQIQTSAASAEVKKVFESYPGIFSCLAYTDNSIRDFFREYQNRPDFKNTIFVITGDHRLIPVPQDSRLSRFRVPLIIYSPMLKTSRNFGSMVTHSDIPAAMLKLLSNNFDMTFPDAMPFISDQMDTTAEFSSKIDLALMRNKGEISDYIYHDYFLSDNILYTIDSTTDITRITNDTMRSALTSKLKYFKLNGIVACAKNQVDKTGSGRKFKSFTLTEADERFLQDETIDEDTPDEIFLKAQTLAFSKSYAESGILLRYLLNKTPNYHDARLLLGRTFAWQNQFDTARYFFDEVVSRSPAYEDAFVALSDVEYWDNEVTKSLQYAERGLKANPNNIELLARQARAFLALGNKVDADRIAKAVLDRNPNQEIALEITIKSK